MQQLLSTYLGKKTSIYPLVTFRVLFGLMLFAGTIRFYMKGWIEEFYVIPKWHFSYYGFEWVKPFPETGMYLLFLLMGISFLFMSLGLFYRISSILAFTSFTYVELIDKTYYLNHYYFVSLILFLLIFVPANGRLSLDCLLKPSLKRRFVPAWCIDIFKLQITIVYFFAGLAKLNPEWLLEAMPLKIWLKSFIDLPLIGSLFNSNSFAYVISWGGAVYDLFIPLLLFSNRFRSIGFIFVLGFHLLTAALFPIGMFPYIMIISALIFFSPQWHKTQWSKLVRISDTNPQLGNSRIKPSKFLTGVLVIFFLLQIALPLRHLAYPGNLFWTEEGYRFSWRVMLMEKAGHAVFEVSDKKNHRIWEVTNSEYLTPVQEKMMSTQSDMILQFANFLHQQFQSEGLANIEIKVKSHVSLNGRPSQLMIEPDVNLLNLRDNLLHKDWIKNLDLK